MLEDVRLGKIQLPDFQREWKWDDPRIASLLATITLGYPIGVVMMLETGGQGVNFAPKPLAGAEGTAAHEAEQLLLDGQQRLTSLYQSLKSQRPVDTVDPRGKKLRRPGDRAEEVNAQGGGVHGIREGQYRRYTAQCLRVAYCHVRW